MNPNPFLGVLLHAIGGFASASFYIPFRKVRHWAWETYWLVGGFFSWIIAPWVLAFLLVPDLLTVLGETPPKSLFWSYFFGAMWGLGGLTFGLTMRYLGIALGMAMALGYCAAFGTLMPPLFQGKLVDIMTKTSGLMTLVGVAVCLVGIAISGLAGMSKERELSAQQKQDAIKEFNFVRGFLVATFAGVMSASMSYGYVAGKPIANLAVEHGTAELWRNIPVFVVVLAGGFTTNFIWCVLLNLRNRTAGDYLNHGYVRGANGLPSEKGDAARFDRGLYKSVWGPKWSKRAASPFSPKDRVPLLANYVFSAIAGVTWYMQFFFFGMGSTQMGKYDFSSWTLHMASIMIFGTLWGVALKEWKGSSKRTHVLIAIGLVVLVGSTVIVGYGNYLGTSTQRIEDRGWRIEKEPRAPRLQVAELSILHPLSSILYAGTAGDARGLEKSQSHPDDLRCEYLINPLGIDVAHPRLSWKLPAEPAVRGQRQTAYQILVAASEATLRTDKGDLWDSGKVESDQSTHVVYAGKPPESRMRCWWKVRFWDKDGHPSDWSAPARWTMGMLKPADWTARWIGLDGADGMGPWGALGASEHRRLPARMLRREFPVAKNVTHATAHVCGLGFFDLYLNGQLVSHQLMNPALTGYDKRALYVTFDVTSHLQQGDNAIGVVLGNGRFFAPRRKVPVPMTTYGYPKLLLQMRIEYDDGSAQEVISAESWKLTANGPIRANSEFDGEEYDARMEQEGWSLPGFNDSAWEKAQLVKPPGGMLAAQMIEPIRVTEALRPKAITQPKPGIFLVDFGQAFYGSVKLKVSGPKGTRVQMHSSFNVTPQGLLNDANDRSALNRDVYTLKGQGLEVWHPRFKGNATRYVQVEGFPGTPTAGNFEGLVTHTDMEPVGQFSCSNNLINRIYSNARWGTRMQNRSVPMEPDRDERMPWSGHPAKTSESEGYAFGVARFYDHFLHNYRVHQGADGSLQEILPPYWTFNSKDIIWPSVITIIPDWYYNFYGDRRILSDNFECMKRWVLFHQKAYQKPDHTIDYCNYGDWVDGSWIKGHFDKRTTSRPLMSTAYHYHNCHIVARAAGLLGKPEDEKFFNDLAEKIKVGFNQRFFKPKTNKYESETQGSYVFPLAFGLVPEDHRAAVIANLVDEIMVKHKGHTSVGLVGMQWFMQVLTDVGHPEVAYTVATRTSRPSWGYMISKGATTSWERWDTDIQDGGMNGESQKILSGNVEAWFYQTLAGINYDPERPGFKHIVLHPRPVGDLTFVKASHRSLYGTIRSDWKIEDGTFRWNVSVPPNTTATVYVPVQEASVVTEGGKPAGQAPGVKFSRREARAIVYEVGAGNYAFASSAATRK